MLPCSRKLNFHVFAVFAFSGAFWLNLEGLGRLLGSTWSLLETSWAQLGLNLGALGANLDARGLNLDALGANLRREGALLDPCMIRRALFDMCVWAHKCIVNQGVHFEK